MKAKLTLLLMAVIVSICISYIYIINSIVEIVPPSMAGTIIWHGSRKLPEVALTFDDGPNSKATPQILDILKKYDVKATFFVLGKFIEKNKGIISREAQEGHVIGNHTYTHASGLITDSNKIKRELTKTNDLIKKYAEQNVKYFRPPFGFESWRFLNEAENLGYTIILWNRDAGDWNHKTGKDIASKILKYSSNGTIILLHDGGASREAVINALPVVIEGLKKKGFKFVTIDEMVSHL
jgi:peptidoglycan/xylan/chitin deacetylase (PgdA/CDA1 family)